MAGRRRTFRNAKWPTFWVAHGPEGLHQYRLRLCWDVLPMAWGLPVDVNVHEAQAYCAWLAEKCVLPPCQLDARLIDCPHEQCRSLLVSRSSMLLRRREPFLFCKVHLSVFCSVIIFNNWITAGVVRGC